MKILHWPHFISVGVFFIFIQFATTAKILFVLPIASKSHVNLFEPLVRALAERDHEIVNLSPVISPKMPANVKQVQIMTIEEIFGGLGNPFEMRKMGKFQAIMNGSFDSIISSCEHIQKTDKFHNILKETYDLIVVDIFMNYCVLGIVPYLQTPSILVSTFAAPPILSNSVGNRLPPSFVPCTNQILTHSMTFMERFLNVIAEIVTDLIWNYKFIDVAEKMYKANFPNGESLPGIFEIQRNTSMIFTNSHFILNYPRPLLPDVVEVGGLHTRPAKPVPKDIEQFLNDTAKHGFILFSLGSIVPANVMPEEYRKLFLRVFSRLNQKVIWKWETESMSDLPPNVLLKKWLPQQDILGHPNIKLFMTHGGLLSTQEAVYHGVPCLGIPMFGDQDLNVKQAENAGYAKFFEILDITDEKLENAIQELLNDTRYYKKAKELSALVRDLPQTPIEKAVYWTEYVLRHKGALHLRSAARDLNFVQYYVLDVAAVMFLILVATLFITYKITRLIFRKLCGGRVNAKDGRMTKLKKQ